MTCDNHFCTIIEFGYYGSTDELITGVVAAGSNGSGSRQPVLSSDVVCGSSVAAVAVRQREVRCPDPKACQRAGRPRNGTRPLSHSLRPDQSPRRKVLRPHGTGTRLSSSPS